MLTAFVLQQFLVHLHFVPLTKEILIEAQEHYLIALYFVDFLSYNPNKLIVFAHLAMNHTNILLYANHFQKHYIVQIEGLQLRL